MTGPLVLCIMSAVWLLGLWVGWSLLFIGEPGSVIESQNRAAATVGETIYYVGFALTTLGVGDYAAGGPLWRFLTVLASANGLVVITLGITYFVSVFSAIIQERTLAKQVRLAGTLAEDAVIWGWDGEGFDRLEGHLLGLTSQLVQMAESIKAFPVIRQYRSAHPWSSAGAAVVMLCDVLAELDLCQRRDRDGRRLSETSLRPLARALDVLLEEVVVAGPADPVRPLDLDRLRAAGLPVLAEARVQETLAVHEGRRRLAVAFALQRGVRAQASEQRGRRADLPGDREEEA